MLNNILGPPGAGQPDWGAEVARSTGRGSGIGSEACSDGTGGAEDAGPVPMISLLDAIVAASKRRALRRIAIFGVHVTMQTALFGRLEGVTDVVPLPPATMDQVGNIYTDFPISTGHAPM
jgi:hypothetical protein